MKFSLENIYTHVVFDVSTLFYSEKRYQQPGEYVLPNQYVEGPFSMVRTEKAYILCIFRKILDVILFGHVFVFTLILVW